MKQSYCKGDVVVTPLGIGEIITNIGIAGDCRVRLEKPVQGGDEAGALEITANTFQMRHVKEGDRK